MFPRNSGSVRVWIALVAGLLLLAGAGWLIRDPRAAQAALGTGPAPGAQTTANGVIVGQDYHHDTSPPLRTMPQIPYLPKGNPHEGNENPRIRISLRKDVSDASAVQRSLAPLAMPATILNFDGVPFPGVVCNCAPPDTDGEVGATQYLQMVSECSTA